MFTIALAQLEAIRTFPTPATLTMNSVFASSNMMGNINVMFYATGNTVYRLDYTSGNAIPIYIHEAGGTITKMDFARPDTPSYDFDVYGVPTTLSLGVLVATGDNSSDLAVINLTESGYVSDDESVRPGTQVFTGFGRGVDIVFI